MSIFEVALESFIDMNHELVLLSKQIDWEAVESEFAEYYCADNGRPSVPIRKMVGMMLLKNIYNLSDEGVVARWMENRPCDPGRLRAVPHNRVSPAAPARGLLRGDGSGDEYGGGVCGCGGEFGGEGRCLLG